MIKKIIITNIFTLLFIAFSLIHINENKQSTYKINDSNFNLQWYLKNDGSGNGIDINSDFCNINNFKEGIDIGALDMWNIFTKKNHNKEIVIAVIDTGIDYTHEDLKNTMWINKNETPNDGIDNDNNGYIDDIYGWNFCENSSNLLSGDEIYENDHGTSIAGIIAAEHNKKGIAGIAGGTNVKIMSIKILKGITHIGNVDNIIKAIKYAEEMGATICNLSFTVATSNEDLKKIINNSNMLFVVAAGNGGINLDETPIYPASYKFDNLISVADIGFDGNLSEKSNYGKKTVDIAAPGTYIYSTTVNDSYNYSSGTSMATAMVTGVAALMLLHDEDLEVDTIKDIITNTSSVSDNLREYIKCAGIINGKKVLSSNNN